MRDALEEERDLVDAVGRTWGVDGQLPLLHQDLSDALMARTSLVVNGVPTGASSVVLSVTNPPVVQGDPGRLAQHVRSWPAGRRGVVAARGGIAAARPAR